MFKKTTARIAAIAIAMTAAMTDFPQLQAHRP